MADERHQLFTVERIDSATLRVSARNADTLLREILREGRERPEWDRSYRLGEISWDGELEHWVAVVRFGMAAAGEGEEGSGRTAGERFPAFVLSLAEVSAGAPEGRAISAGLLTLQLVDAILDSDSKKAAAGSFGFRSARAAVSGLEGNSGARSLLSAVLDMLEQPERKNIVGLVAPRLLAYARDLQMAGRWGLGADVCRAVLGRLEPRDGFDLIINAHLQLARCLRRMACWQEAGDAVSTACTLAAVSGYRAGELRAQTIKAELASDRGNLPEAQALLDEVVANARGARLIEVLASALLHRGYLAYRRHDYSAAIADGSEAIQSSADSTIRYRGLNDIALAFLELGIMTAARDAWSIVAEKADEYAMRITAWINLLELSIKEGNEFAFEETRRRLTDSMLTPVQHVYLELCLGQGYSKFGRYRQARAALERALAMAERHHLNEFIIQAEEALATEPDAGVIISASSEEDDDRYPIRAAGESCDGTDAWRGVTNEVRAAAGKVRELRLALSGVR